MNIFKKAAACLAATAVMTSVAVTASAEYNISGVNGNDGKYYMRIVGIPEQITNDLDPNSPVGALGRLYVNVPSGADQTFTFIISTSTRTGDTSCTLFFMGLNMQYPCNLVRFDNKLGYVIEFDSDDVLLEGLLLTDVLDVAAGVADLIVDETAGTATPGQYNYYFSDGSSATYDNAYERVNVSWEKVGETAESEPTDSEATGGYVEPEESEPASSEPVSEPASSETVSEPASSETSSSSPSNVDTGVTGIAAVVGTAVLAVGAVIVSRKRK